MSTDAVAGGRNRGSWLLASGARSLPKGAVVLFIAALGLLTLTPLVRLQILAFENGGSAYTDAFTKTGIWHTVATTIELALGSLAIALVLGTGLAWAATMLPSRLWWLRIIPILPIIIPSVASILGWMFLFSPGPGYLNQLLRHLPWWSDQLQGEMASPHLRHPVMRVGNAVLGPLLRVLSWGLR